MTATVLLSLLLSLHQPQADGILHITIENIKAPEGQLIVALFNSKESYLQDDFRSQIIEVTGVTKDVIFENLPSGYYSVSIIYDKNKNGILDKNFFGIPREGFGFSRKSLGAFGPPSYDDTKIKVDVGTESITIPLKYML
ncbi:hypothetical protein C900_00533 [Fulvivirga imtechensis AK7]|uniref:DUF2141 domain-containing protein n=1 Tax=Fulvivirga imtechensis AK7 TaxID=1237149 RepID=L8JHI6_9BACT|nr:DUF2141 domain-containing protein [Fulvivirga imtechensis]ELR68306.1 hypothetical protein C900_00533 [Fulvivirga imtechensis AK7]